MKEYVRTILDYPVKGIQFRDITTLLQDAGHFKQVIDEMTNPWKNLDIDAVLSIESRGFIMAGAIAYHIGAAFIPLRKPDKLPGETFKVSYTLEYGSTEMHIHKDALDNHKNLLIIDDLIATGGTAEAAAKLIEISGGNTIWIDNAYASSNNDSGIATDSNFDGVLWIRSPDCRGNGEHGIEIGGTNHNKIHISTPHCAHNSQSSSGTYSGIFAVGANHDIQIIGGQCGGDMFGNTAGQTPNNASMTQKSGIWFTSNNNLRILINSVDVTNNKVNAINWETSGNNVAAASHNYIQHCLGYSTGQTTFPGTAQ